MDGKPQMRKVGCEEWHTVVGVEDAEFGYDIFDETDVIGIVACFLGDEDVGLGEFEGGG